MWIAPSWAEKFPCLTLRRFLSGRVWPSWAYQWIWSAILEGITPLSPANVYLFQSKLLSRYLLRINFTEAVPSLIGETGSYIPVRMAEKLLISNWDREDNGKTIVSAASVNLLKALNLFQTKRSTTLTNVHNDWESFHAASTSVLLLWTKIKHVNLISATQQWWIAHISQSSHLSVECRGTSLEGILCSPC